MKAGARFSRICLSALSILGLVVLSTPSAQAVNYTITYNANASQHQTGVTSGSVPSPQSYAAGTVVTVSGNTGTLARQGFTFAGWNTLSTGAGTNYTAGSGTLTLNADITLYANWTIPSSARLIGNGGAVVNITDPNSVTGGSNCTGSNFIRGITSDGTNVYFRPSVATTYLCKVDMSGYVVQAINVGTDLSNIGIDSIDLTYSSGCIFLRPDGGANTNIKCIDTSDWKVYSLTLPEAWYAGSGWLTGNIIDFPDGRIGAVSAPNTSAPNGVGTGAGQCPSGMYCKILKLFNVVGTGKNAAFTFSENIVLADDVSGWPSDEHGIATDGTYLYEIMFSSGFKVWALRSGGPSYLVFNGSGAGACTASTGVSGSLCPINAPVNGSTVITSNATFLGRNHIAGSYLMGDYSANRFYKSDYVFPPAGPGSLNTISSFNSFSLAGSVTTTPFRTPVVITANLSTASKVTFKLNGRVIVGCKNRPTSGSTPNIVATCSWKPTQHGELILSATAVPTNPLVSTSNASIKIVVGLRSGSRG